MGYNKDLISPSHDHLHNTNYTITSHTLAHCNINDNIRRNDEREPKDKEKDMQLYPRWNPTPEQMILLEKVYNGGTRTPTTQQIQEIASMLQNYGRIEGKNVFYWFQNHKSRERLKRRRPDHIQGFVANKDHEEEAPPLRKDSSTASRRRGDRRVCCLSSSSPTHPPQNNNTDDGKRGIVEEKVATCQNQTKPINTYSDFNYNLIITSKTSQEAEHKYNLNEEEEEETRKNRTLDLFPVIDNQEKTGLAEKNPKQNQKCCNYYYYYEFMPLIN